MLNDATERERGLAGFARDALGLDAEEASWTPVAGDASARRYFRLAAGERSWVCADSPPATERNAEFLAVRDLLADSGMPVPVLLASDLERGFLVLEDFGDRHLLQELDIARPSAGYGGALDLLFELQGVDARGGRLPPYSREVLEEELSRFYQWYCLAWLGCAEQPAVAGMIDELGERLVESALAQPQVFVFRDYHSRNLLCRPGGRLGLIDFQDALLGPLCYDLVSLLRDCYIRWPEEQVRQWALVYRQRLLAAGRPAGGSDAMFLRWFDWIGLQRHLKVLGNFTRLALRDGKTGYLADIPRVLDYVETVLARYPEFSEILAWWRSELLPRAQRRGAEARP